MWQGNGKPQNAPPPPIDRIDETAKCPTISSYDHFQRNFGLICSFTEIQIISGIYYFILHWPYDRSDSRCLFPFISFRGEDRNSGPSASFIVHGFKDFGNKFDSPCYIWFCNLTITAKRIGQTGNNSSIDNRH